MSCNRGRVYGQVISSIDFHVSFFFFWRNKEEDLELLQIKKKKERKICVKKVKKDRLIRFRVVSEKKQKFQEDEERSLRKLSKD